MLSWQCSTSKKTVVASPSDPSTIVHSGGDNTRLFIDGLKEKSLGNFDEAISLFQQAIEVNPEDAASYFELAKLSLHKNQFEASLEYAAKAAEIAPENLYYQVLYARLLQTDEQHKKAISIFKKILENNPQKFDFYNYLAEAYILNGDLTEAIETYDKLEEIVGVNEDISFQKKKLYLELNKPQKAIREIEVLASHFPYNAGYFASLADMYVKNDMDEEALQAFDKILELDPYNPYIHITLAEFYKKKGDDEKAFEEMKLGFKNKNLNIDEKIQILLAYYTVNEIYGELKEEAMELAHILVEVHPLDPKSYSMLGDFLYQDGQLKKSEEAFRAVIALDSTRYPVWEQLLFINSELRNDQQVIDDGLITIEFFPEQALPYLFTGGAYYNQKEWEACVEILEKGLFFLSDQGPIKSQFMTYLGDAYYQLKKYNLSDQSYEEALSLDPENSYVLNNYAYYLSLRDEQLEKAGEMAKRATELDPENTANQDTYGWVLFKLGYFLEAEKWIKKAIDNGEQKNAVILEHYGDVLWHLDQKEDALHYWIKASEMENPGKLLQQKIDSKTYITD